MATGGCYFDVKNDQFSFDVGDKHVEFNLFNALKVPSIFNYHRIYVINHLVWEIITNQILIDSLEHCTLNDAITRDDNPEVVMHAQLLEASS